MTLTVLASPIMAELRQQQRVSSCVSDLQRWEQFLRPPLRHVLIAARQAALQTCGQLLDEHHNYTQAVQQVRALMFIKRFASDVDARLDQMDTADGGH